MRASSIIMGTMLLFAIACKKDKKTTEEEIIEGLGWKAEQEVRILKVEQKQKLWAIPFKAQENVVVKYFYDEAGEISKITYSNLESPDNYIHNWSKSSNEYLMSGFEMCLGTIRYDLKNNQYNFDLGRISSILSNYGFCSFSGDMYGNQKRDVKFNYSESGFLLNINSVFNIIISEEDTSNLNSKFLKSIKELKFQNNSLIDFNVINSNVFESREIELENYKVKVSYNPAKDVPDGLRRLVNQAILGLSSIGMEEFFNNPEYVNDSRAAIDPTVSTSVFADWIYSFACPQIQSIPAQGVGLVSQKQIKGKRVSHVDNELPMPYIFTEVDSTANFPYIHDASAKTLEIAGLKIYYELVE